MPELLQRAPHPGLHLSNGSGFFCLKERVSLPQVFEGGLHENSSQSIQNPDSPPFMARTEVHSMAFVKTRFLSLMDNGGFLIKSMQGRPMKGLKYDGRCTVNPRDFWA